MMRRMNYFLKNSSPMLERSEPSFMRIYSSNRRWTVRGGSLNHNGNGSGVVVKGVIDIKYVDQARIVDGGSLTQERDKVNAY